MTCPMCRGPLIDSVAGQACGPCEATAKARFMLLLTAEPVAERCIRHGHTDLADQEVEDLTKWGQEFLDQHRAQGARMRMRKVVP